MIGTKANTRLFLLRIIINGNFAVGYFYSMILVLVLSMSILMVMSTSARADESDVTTILAAINRPCEIQDDWVEGDYGEWEDDVTFVDNSSMDTAVDWLLRNIGQVNLDGKYQHVVSFYDPALEDEAEWQWGWDPVKEEPILPEEPVPYSVRAAYLITDGILATKALSAYDSFTSQALARNLIDHGWYGNGLIEVIFHDLGHEGLLPFEGLGRDAGQGWWLAKCPTGDKSYYVHVLQMQENQDFSDFYNLFADLAVFQAFHFWWNGMQDQAKQIIKGVFMRTGANDKIFWDPDGMVLVDWYNLDPENTDFGAQWQCWNDRNPFCPYYFSSTYKLAYLFYAFVYMNIADDMNWCGQGYEACGQWALGLHYRIMQSEIANDSDCFVPDVPGIPSYCPDVGGFPHSVAFTKPSSGTGSVLFQKSMATGEATSLGILANSIREYDL